MDGVIEEVRRRTWNWIGHVLRRGSGDECLVQALGRTPERKGNSGRSKTTWRPVDGVERRGRLELVDLQRAKLLLTERYSSLMCPVLD